MEESRKEGCVAACVGIVALVAASAFLEGWTGAVALTSLGILAGLFGGFRLIENMPRWYAFCWSAAGVVCIHLAPFIA